MGRYLVTGANRGIGLELCRQLVDRGDEVIGTCRGDSDELKSLGIRVEAGVDVADDEAVRGLARRIEGISLDVLLNNAGILERVGFEALDLDSCRRQFEVNSLGPLRLTRALANNLSAGSKIAILTSLMGSMGDNSSGGSYGYRMSKAAVNAAAPTVMIANSQPSWSSCQPTALPSSSKCMPDVAGRSLMTPASRPNCSR